PQERRPTALGLPGRLLPLLLWRRGLGRGGSETLPPPRHDRSCTNRSAPRVSCPNAVRGTPRNALPPRASGCSEKTSARNPLRGFARRDKTSPSHLAPPARSDQKTSPLAGSRPSGPYAASDTTRTPQTSPPALSAEG